MTWRAQCRRCAPLVALDMAICPNWCIPRGCEIPAMQVFGSDGPAISMGCESSRVFEIGWARLALPVKPFSSGRTRPHSRFCHPARNKERTGACNATARGLYSLLLPTAVQAAGSPLKLVTDSMSGAAAGDAGAALSAAPERSAISGRPSASVGRPGYMSRTARRFPVLAGLTAER